MDKILYILNWNSVPSSPHHFQSDLALIYGFNTFSLSLFLPVCSQYNLSPPISEEAPKSHSLERKQQEPIVLTKWRHSTYVLDITDKVHVYVVGHKVCTTKQSTALFFVMYRSF